MRKLLIVIIAFFFSLPVYTHAQEKKEGKKFEMVQYYFVMLMKGTNRTQPDSIAQKIQAGHMANITKMAEEGFLVCAGPFADDKGGGIYILKVKTAEEARKLVEGDPAIKAGRLSYEIRPWLTAKGSFKNEK